MAIVSMALGIGANGAMFSIFEQVILRALPVSEPGELVNLSSPGPKPGSQSNNNAGGMDYVFSYPMTRDLERLAGEHRELWSGVAAHRTMGVNLAYEGNTSSGEGTLVSGSYFPVLGLTPALGRLLDRKDDITIGAHPVVVLSHGFWRSRFDSSPDILNRALLVNGQPLTVVGVAPEGFRGTTLGSEPRVFVPLSMRNVLQPGWEGFEDRRKYWVYLFARLAPGVDSGEARAALDLGYRQLIQDVELELQEGMSDQGLEQFAARQILLEPGEGGQSDLKQESRIPLLLLLGVSGLVLLIACANVSNLLLAKATNRSSEIAIRLSIGARRRHVVAQLLSESLLLALFGGLLGTAVAVAVLELILAILPPEAGDLVTGSISPPTAAFLVLLTLACGLVGLFPALHATGHDLLGKLRSVQDRSTRSRTAVRFRNTLATAQIALSLALLFAAGLFVKSLANIGNVDLGVDIDRLSTFSVSPRRNGHHDDQSRALLTRIEAELRALPGVAGVTSSIVPLIAGSNWGTGVSVQGYPSGPDVDHHSQYNEVGVGYFRSLGMPLLAGREFELADDLGTPKVAVVNEAFARKFGLERDALDKYMATSTGNAVELDIRIVGLVRDAKYSDVKQKIPPVFFTPHSQDDTLGFLNFYVRSSGEPDLVLSQIRQAVARVDPDLPVEDLRTMDDQIRQNLTLERVLGILSTAFSVLATVLAGVGLYGVLAYSVAQKKREIGLRMALGAGPARVRRLILREVGRVTIPGAILGLLAAFAIGRAATSLLFELEGSDPTVLAVALLVLSGVAVAAALVPARRAATIDPMTVLRDD